MTGLCKHKYDGTWSKKVSDRTSVVIQASLISLGPPGIHTCYTLLEFEGISRGVPGGDLCHLRSGHPALGAASLWSSCDVRIHTSASTAPPG